MGDLVPVVVGAGKAEGLDCLPGARGAGKRPRDQAAGQRRYAVEKGSTLVLLLSCASAPVIFPLPTVRCDRRPDLLRQADFSVVAINAPYLVQACFQTCRSVFPVETPFGNTPIEHYPRAFLCAGFVAGAATDCLQCALSAVKKLSAGSRFSSIRNH